MRVAFFTHYVQLYGANRSLLNLIDGLKSYKVESFVVAPGKGALIDSLEERKVPCMIVPLQWWSSERLLGNDFSERVLKYLEWRKNTIIKLLLNAYSIPKICKQLKEWGIDILYSNSSVIPIGAMVGMWLNKPHIWHVREFGSLDYNLHLHWGQTLFNFFFKRADAQICISQAIRSFYGNSLNADKCHVVYNGVASKKLIDKLREETIKSQKSTAYFNFAIVGLIHPNKGQDIAIHALSLIKDSHPKTRLIIAGEDNHGGIYIKQLQNYATQCGVEKQVIFCGFASNPYDIYRQTDAVLMCSINEALGRVTIEAMTSCKPVIGYKSGGTTELILNEVNGLLYEGDYTNLACCMRRLIENPSWANEMGEKGWSMAKDSYSTETYSRKIHEILIDVMKRKNKRFMK